MFLFKSRPQRYEELVSYNPRMQRTTKNWLSRTGVMNAHLWVFRPPLYQMNYQILSERTKLSSRNQKMRVQIRLETTNFALFSAVSD